MPCRPALIFAGLLSLSVQAVGNDAFSPANATIERLRRALAASYGRLGYSSAGGLTVNPYNTARDVSGSSSGSAAAVAADFAAFAVGTDTGGSVRAPANV